MMIEKTKTKSFRIVNASGLDPINVVLRDVGAGSGELIVTCYGLAWTAYWGAMGERSVEEFVRSVSADYVANRMWIPHERRVKNRYAYLVRIIEAVQAALKMPSEQSPIDPAEAVDSDRSAISKALLSQRRISEDGEEVAVSRKACDEAAELLARGDPAAADPVAYVPVHPRNGPLWASTIPSPECDHPKSYPLMRLYADPTEAEKAREQSKAIDLPGFMKPDTTERVHFYEQEFYVLSNFSAFNLRWNRHIFATSEHAYHWSKFPPLTRDERGRYVRDDILNAPSAHEAFKLAERWKILRRDDWDEVKVEIMREILRAKADQHEYVRRKLLETGDRELVEDSWRDDFWGWGPQREGKNMLGKLWMEIRAELRSEIEEQARRVE